MNLAPVVIFAYNRPVHLQQTIFALAANELAAQSQLIIICDGPKLPRDPAVDAVRHVAKTSVGFLSVRVMERETNLGLGPNIIDGVTTMLQQHDRVIVLEDDLETSPFFLRYMNDGLNFFAENHKVASIMGWFFPHAINSPPETFFIRGADCLGWATWKRAWDVFEPDAQKLLTAIHERNLQNLFDLDGAYPYTEALEQVAKGLSNTWAIRWLASAFLADMYTLYPGKSLVAHRGYDAAGTNCPTPPPWGEDVISIAPVAVKEMPTQECNTMREEMKKALRSGRGASKPFLLKRIINKIKRLF